jgi:hypothetical protein
MLWFVAVVVLSAIGATVMAQGAPQHQVWLRYQMNSARADSMDYEDLPPGTELAKKGLLIFERKSWQGKKPHHVLVRKLNGDRTGAPFGSDSLPLFKSHARRDTFPNVFPGLDTMSVLFDWRDQHNKPIPPWHQKAGFWIRTGPTVVIDGDGRKHP